MLEESISERVTFSMFITVLYILQTMGLYEIRFHVFQIRFHFFLTKSHDFPLYFLEFLFVNLFYANFTIRECVLIILKSSYYHKGFRAQVVFEHIYAFPVNFRLKNLSNSFPPATLLRSFVVFADNQISVKLRLVL